MLYQRKNINKNIILRVTPAAWSEWPRRTAQRDQRSLTTAFTQNFLTNYSEIKVEELKKKIIFYRERRAARRAALGLTEPETNESTNSRKNERTTRKRADSKGSNNDRGHLEVTSPVNDSRPLSPRSSPRPSPRSSPRSSPTQRRKFKFEEPKTEGECGVEWIRSL